MASAAWACSSTPVGVSLVLLLCSLSRACSTLPPPLRSLDAVSFFSPSSWTGANCPLFTFSLGCNHFSVAFMEIRAARSVGEERSNHVLVSAGTKGTVNVLTGVLWCTIAVLLNAPRDTTAGVSLAKGLWVLALAVEWISYSVFFASGHLVKVSQEYAVSKYQTVCVMVLSATFVGAANGLDPAKLPVESRSIARISCLLGFLTFINLKVLVVDADVFDHNDHAVTKGPLRRWAWNMTQPCVIISMVSAGASMGYLLHDASGDPYTTKVLSYAMAATFSLVTLQRALHDKTRLYFKSYKVARAMDFRMAANLFGAGIAALLPWFLMGAPSVAFTASFAALSLALVGANIAAHSAMEAYLEQTSGSSAKGLYEFVTQSNSYTGEGSAVVVTGSTRRVTNTQEPKSGEGSELLSSP